MDNTDNKSINILFMYICCFKYKEKWEKIKLLNKDSKTPFVILCGKELDKDFELIDNILYLNCDDAYEGLPEKVCCGLSAILKIPQFSNITHILKIDDDNDCNPQEVVDSLINKSHKILNSYDYIGQRLHDEHHIKEIINNDKSRKAYEDSHPEVPKWPHPREWHFGRVNKNCYWFNKRYDGPYVPWADGGCSYILSRKAASLITIENNFNTLIDIRKKAIYEDVFIGLTLKKYNIIPFQHKFFIKGDKPAVN